MGKHQQENIIFCNENDQTPGQYQTRICPHELWREACSRQNSIPTPATQEKKNPFELTEFHPLSGDLTRPLPTAKAIYTSITGISPLMAEEICHRANIDGGIPTDGLSDLEKLHLAHTVLSLIEDIKNETFTPNIVYKGREPVEFAPFTLTQFADLESVSYPTISQVLETYYAEKNIVTQNATKIRRPEKNRTNCAGTKCKKISTAAEKH